jgi:hypothetical protein
MLRVRFISTAMCAVLASGMTYAQDAMESEQPVFEAPAQYAPVWSDEGIASIADQFSGTWTTTGEVGGSTLMMSVVPAPIEGMSDTLYVESVRAETPWDPYRNAIFQLYRYKGEVRLRTYEFAVGSTSMGLFDGIWAATEYFPSVSRDDLIATLDVELDATSNGFSGSTPYPYPTGVGGAVEMTSSMTLEGDILTVADRGYGADGSVVWGADSDSSVEYARSDWFAEVERRDDGMIVVDYGPQGGDLPHEGDELHVHYEGFLTDGTRFDSSYTRDLPFVFAYPPGTRAITGWGIGMEGFANGSHRKLIIPGYLGYGERGNPRANIPGDATLVFNVWMAHIDHSSHDGHDHDHDHGSHEGHNHD